MSKPTVLVLHWLPDGELARWNKEFPQFDFVDARQPDAFERHKRAAVICYGLPDVARLDELPGLLWIQLASAGVPSMLCPAAQARGIGVTNLAGLYGPTIAEHALALLLILSRNLNVVQKNQAEALWDRTVAQSMRHLHGRTMAIIGLGNIGQHIARLAQAFGMRVVGCRRKPRPTPFVDWVVGPDQAVSILSDADVLAVAAPLTRATEGMLGPREFTSLRPDSYYINISRGPVAQEAALLAALHSGPLGGAGMDVFAVEPLPIQHPFWSMPNVVISPHYSGETVNNSALPAQRFLRNLRRWQTEEPFEGNVDLEHGY